MKKKTLIAVPVLIALTVAIYFRAEAAPKRSTIMGEVIDVISYATKGVHGEEAIEEGQYRAENGFPVGILEPETGVVYIAVYRNPAPAAVVQLANKILIPLMGKPVVAQGRVYKQKGVNVIEIAVISEM